MKQETNNEMDLLLRRLGRRPDIPVSDANGDVDHLDADELNAYAENVLPAAARARYTEHLAECARCRDLIVQLSSSAGVPVVEPVKAVEPSGLRKFLASLFSPMVLRYAVPALGLILVAVIGLFVSRQKQSDGDSIAQKTEAPASRPFVSPTTPEPAAPASQLYDQQSKEDVPAKQAQSSGSPENQSAAAVPAAPPAPPIVDESSRDDLAKKAQQPVATEAPVTAAPKPIDTREQQAKTEAREEAAQARAANEPPAEKAKAAETDKVKVRVEDRKAAEVEPARSAPSVNTTGAFGGSVAGAARTRGQRDDAVASDKDKNDAETRTVAGRRFRKQDGVWTDTAYNSSRSPVNLTRGSEQYRALIADEPGIKTIADQLDGEIIVVWKGHTYRIR